MAGDVKIGGLSGGGVIPPSGAPAPSPTPVAPKDTYLLAQADPVKKPAAKAPAKPKLEETQLKILEKVPKNLQKEIEAIFSRPDSKAAKILTAISLLAANEEERTSFFSFALPTLLEWKVLPNLGALNGKEGDILLELAKKAKGGTGEFVHFGLRRLMDAKVVPAKEAAQAFTHRAPWLFNLATAAGNMNSEQRWKVFHFGFGNLLEVKILKKEKLDDLFQYREGFMLFEMARATHIIEAGKDYFGFMLSDWLIENEATDLNSQVIGGFIRATSDLASKFYAAGRALRKKQGGGDSPPMWKLVVGNFRGLLPLSNIPKLLALMTRVLEDPYDSGLAAFVQEKKRLNILFPVTVEDLRHIQKYGEFLESLTQVAGLKEKWVKKNVTLARLSERYRREDPEIVIDVVMVLNGFISEYGDEWLKKAGVPVPSWEGGNKQIEVLVDVTTIRSVFAKHYIIKNLRPNDLKRYKFVWQNGKPGQVTVSNLSRMILMHGWLRELVGEEAAAKVFDQITLDGMKLDLRGIPDEVMVLKGLNDIRLKLNEQSSSVRTKEGGRVLMGDRFIEQLSNMLSTAIIVPPEDPRVHEGGRYVSISVMVRIFKGWSDFKEARNMDFAYDLMGPYKTLAGYIGAGVRDYFDNHREAFLAREDNKELRGRLKGLDKPLWLDRARDMSDDLMDFLEANK